MTTPISSERNIAVSSRSSRLSKQISSTRVRVASACRGGRRRLVLTVFVAICLPLLAVCGKDSPTQPEPSAPPPAPPPTPVPTRTDVTPSSATLNAIGQTLQLAVQVFDQNNAVMNGASVVWSSSDASVATVSGQGLVTAVSNGSATITAHSGTVSASVPVTVMQSAGSIAIEPAMAVLMSLGETVQLSATVLDGN
ncbi:MAG: Ig-like domain-containing protein, partial [Chloroflexi bacterium]|nr:Ig-like domain-containing protein [Chloroflexota bacterium]